MARSYKRRPAPPYDRVRELLDYHPETGVFWWRTSGLGRKASGIAGSVGQKGYVTICIDRVHYFAQRLAWYYMTGEWPAHDVDHRNLDRSDNRFQNLRPATRSQNLANKAMHANNASGYKGVVLHKQSGLWCARIGIDGKSVSLGYYDTPKEAHDAYAAGAKKHYGEFARTA